MLDLKEYVVTNLINGYKNHSFSNEQVSIFAMNYMLKGILTESDVESISNEMEQVDNTPIVEAPIYEEENEEAEEITENTEDSTDLMEDSTETE